MLVWWLSAAAGAAAAALGASSSAICCERVLIAMRNGYETCVGPVATMFRLETPQLAKDTSSAH